MAAAAFSVRPPFDESEPDAIPEGRQLSFREATTGVLEFSMARLLIPNVGHSP